MSEDCGRTFDEELLSGHVDGALTQGDAQRVRLHLEECATCRALVDELAAVRDATMSSTFDLPRDHEWSEAPRTGASRMLRGLGWPIIVAWIVVVVGYGIWEALQEAENLIERLILAGGVSGIGLLFLSALLDRLKAMTTDRYREVHK